MSNGVPVSLGLVGGDGCFPRGNDGRSREESFGRTCYPLSDGVEVDFCGMVGGGPRMRAIQQLIRRAGACNLPVLIRGETGVGTELVARAIHEGSPRRKYPFIPVSRATISEDHLEGELFGCPRGAFTGAAVSGPGLIEAADGGVLFFDEVAEASSLIQAKLLRVLDSGEVRRLGSTDFRRVDVRIIAATNQDLLELIRCNCFRQDLFDRLSGLTVVLPFLRELLEEIPRLLACFLATESQRLRVRIPILTEEAIRQLVTYPWAGNIRELRNVVEYLCVLCREDGVIDAELVSWALSGHGKAGSAISSSHATCEYGCDAVEKIDGNLSEVTRLLGTHRSAIYRRLMGRYTV